MPADRSPDALDSTGVRAGHEHAPLKLVAVISTVSVNVEPKIACAGGLITGRLYVLRTTTWPAPGLVVQVGTVTVAPVTASVLELVLTRLMIVAAGNGL